MHVKPENLRGAANICSDGGKHPLAAMFGADETQRGGGLAIYCLFYNKEKRTMDTVKAEFPADGNLRYKIFYYQGCRREVRLFFKEEGFNERRI